LAHLYNFGTVSKFIVVELTIIHVVKNSIFERVKQPTTLNLRYPDA